MYQVGFMWECRYRVNERVNGVFIDKYVSVKVGCKYAGMQIRQNC